MKLLVLLSVLGFVLASCETTVLSESICGNDRVDLVGFNGSLSLTFGGGENFPANILRTSKGEYTLEDSEVQEGDNLKFIVCKSGGELMAEIPANTDSGGKGYMLMNVQVTRKAFIFRSALVDQDLLLADNIPFTFGESDMEETQGVPLSFVEIDNTGVVASRILLTRGNPEGKTPFGLTFLK